MWSKVVWYPMEKWLEIPTDRKRLPSGRLCVILALSVLLFLTAQGRKAHSQTMPEPAADACAFQARSDFRLWRVLFGQVPGKPGQCRF